MSEQDPIVELTDEFKGDDAALCRSIDALLRLDAAGALAPHGVGGFARTLLQSASLRLAHARKMVEPAPSVQALTINEALEKAGAVWGGIRGKWNLSPAQLDAFLCYIAPQPAPAVQPTHAMISAFKAAFKEGSIWEDRITAGLRAALAAVQPSAEVCWNCDTALPKGCEGLFLSDGEHCKLHGAKPSATGKREQSE